MPISIKNFLSLQYSSNAQNNHLADNSYFKKIHVRATTFVKNYRDMVAQKKEIAAERIDRAYYAWNNLGTFLKVRRSIKTSGRFVGAFGLTFSAYSLLKYCIVNSKDLPGGKMTSLAAACLSAGLAWQGSHQMSIAIQGYQKVIEELGRKFDCEVALCATVPALIGVLLSVKILSIP